MPVNLKNQKEEKRAALVRSLGLAKTVRWYLDNGAWLSAIQTREYQSWISLQYETTA